MTVSRLAILALATALAAAAQTVVTGVVRDAAGSPVSKAYVLALAGEPQSVVAQAATDDQGRYRLETSETRFALTAEAAGHYVLRAGDADADQVVLACPDSGDCGPADFTLACAAVFDGWLTDRYGNPVQSIEMNLIPNSEGSPARRRVQPAQQRNRNTTTASDDRGYFRFWGLQPGSYQLTSRVRWRSPIADPPELDETVEIPAGEESVRRSFQLVRPAEPLTISGVLQGVDPDDKRWITLEPLAGGERQIVYVDGGKFYHELPPGKYVARLEQVINADPAAHQADLLGEIDVTGDMEDLVLRPQPPTGVRIHTAFVDAPPAAFRLELRLKNQPAAEPRPIQFAKDQREIARHGFRAGIYVPTIRSQDLWVVEPLEISVLEGQLTKVELRISAERSRVTGTARFAAEDGKTEAVHITVAIRGRETRSVQTDQSGGFAFDNVIPGKYEIAAWARPEAEADWQEAGDRVQRIVVEPGFEVEVDLTVTP